MDNDNSLNLGEFDDSLLDEIIDGVDDEHEISDSDRMAKRKRRFYVPLLFSSISANCERFSNFYDFLHSLFLNLQCNLSGTTEIEFDSSSSVSNSSDSESEDDLILDADEYYPSGDNNLGAIENTNDLPSSSHIIESTDSNVNNNFFF